MTRAAPLLRYDPFWSVDTIHSSAPWMVVLTVSDEGISEAVMVRLSMLNHTSAFATFALNENEKYL